MHQSVTRERDSSQCLSCLIPLFSEPGHVNQGVIIQTVVSRGTSASQNIREQRGLTSNMVHSKICHDDR